MVAAIIALATALANGQPAPGTIQVQSPPASATAQDDQDKIVCRTEAETGSRFTKRICLTKAQMDERDRRLAEYERQRQNMAGMASHSTNAMSGQ